MGAILRHSSVFPNRNHNFASLGFPVLFFNDLVATNFRPIISLQSLIAQTVNWRPVHLRVLWWSTFSTLSIRAPSVHRRLPCNCLRNLRNPQNAQQRFRFEIPMVEQCVHWTPMNTVKESLKSNVPIHRSVAQKAYQNPIRNTISLN